MTRGYAYLRVSGKGQLEGDGFTRQRTAIQSYAKSHNIRVVKWFEEQGVSGTKDLENRPALQDMLVALHGDGVRLVLIEKLDRLARDLMIQETIIGDLRKHDFQIVSVAEPDLCSDDPSRKLVRQVFGAIAEYERAMIVLKLRAARERMRKRTGSCEGRKPFGTRPGEKEIIARMKSLAEKGLNFTEIADQLNREGVPTRAQGAWYPATISRILARE